MAQIFKIKLEDTLRRVCVPLQEDKHATGFSFSELEAKVRELFQIPCTSRVIITYMDAENDVVTMADDQDLMDACMTQQLNPLRLEVKVVAMPSMETGDKATVKESKALSPPVTEFDVEGLLKGLFPEATAKAIEEILNRYPPCLFTTVPAHVLPEALDTFLKTLTGYGDTQPTKSQVTSLSPMLFSQNRSSTCQQSMESPHQTGRHSKVEATPGRIVHKSIECDHCGMNPIVGPRYKSMKKYDYDLCSNCFDKIGNSTDYHRMGRPMIHKNHCHYPLASIKAGEHQSSGCPPSRAVFSRGPYGWTPIQPANTHPPKDDKGVKGNLDAQFLLDINILDGTEVAAGTDFTKIWRLRNSGTSPWPQQTQLIHIAGNSLGSDGTVNLKLPEGGLPCGGVMDVHVNLTAPETAGRHVAHWCLMAPSGQMFGDKMWVLVQVVPKGSNKQVPGAKESFSGEATLKGVDDCLLSKCIIGIAGSDLALSDSNLVVDLDPTESVANSCLKVPLVDIINSPQLADSDEQQVELDGFSLVETELAKEPINDEKLPSVEEFEFNNEKLASVEEFELVDPLNYLCSEVLPGKPAPFSVPVGADEDLLGKLESMGYAQREVNVELLQKNNNDLHQTVDDLVASAGWDHMLKDLEEMGFYDTQTNRHLLFKNEGSIKRAVKELVEMEKQMSFKEKAA